MTSTKRVSCAGSEAQEVDAILANFNRGIDSEDAESASPISIDGPVVRTFTQTEAILSMLRSGKIWGGVTLAWVRRLSMVVKASREPSIIAGES